MHVAISLRFLSLPEEVRHFYVLAALRNALGIMFSVFAPIYVYALFGDVGAVVLYLLIDAGVVRILVKPLSVWLVGDFGLEISSLASLGLLIPATLLFVLVSDGILAPSFLFVAALFHGASMALYWDTYHTSFGVFGKPWEKLQERAIFELVNTLLHVVLPLLSATLIFFLGFSVFFSLTASISILGAIYLLRRFRRRYRVKIHLTSLLKEKYRLLWILEGGMSAFLLLVPLYLFIRVGLLGFGATRSFAALLVAIANVWVAQRLERGRMLHVIPLAYVVTGFSALFLTLASSITAPVFETLRVVSFLFASGSCIVAYRLAASRPSAPIARNFWVDVGKIAVFASLLVTQSFYVLVGLLVFLTVSLPLILRRVLPEVVWLEPTRERRL